MIIINSVKFYNHPFINNYLGSKNGDIYSLKSKKILSKNRKNDNNYLTFYFYNKEKNKYQNYYQHRFIYEVFKGKIPPHLEVDHIVPNKSDNRIKNLQLLSHKENIEKSKNKPIISINIKTGEKKKFKSVKSASEELNIWKSNISNICYKKKYYKTATSKKDGCKYIFEFFIV